MNDVALYCTYYTYIRIEHTRDPELDKLRKPFPLHRKPSPQRDTANGVRATSSSSPIRRWTGGLVGPRGACCIPASRMLIRGNLFYRASLVANTGDLASFLPTISLLLALRIRRRVRSFTFGRVTLDRSRVPTLSNRGLKRRNMYFARITRMARSSLSITCQPVRYTRYARRYARRRGTTRRSALPMQSLPRGADGNAKMELSFGEAQPE